MLRDGQKELEIRVASRTKELLQSNTPLAEQVEKLQKADNIIRTERDKFQCILAAMKQGMHIVNADHEIEFQNKVLIDVCGDIQGHKCYEVYAQADRPCTNCRMEQAVQTNTVILADELTMNNRIFSRSYAPFTNIDGKNKCLILFNDITEKNLPSNENPYQSTCLFWRTFCRNSP